MTNIMQKNIIKKYKLILLITITLLIYINILYSKTIIINIRVCLCTIGKKENLYIREYIDHYKKYGVDKIFIYDNNDKNDEKFEEILNDDINKGFVQIINYRGKLAPQNKAYYECYQMNYKEYNWIIFYDMDEFIFLKKYKNIKFFLNKKIFNKCERIQLNFLLHTDNNLIFYDNRTLKERFPQVEKKAKVKKKRSISIIKSIIRGNITINKIDNVHIINHKLISCDGFGKIKKYKSIKTDNPDFKYYYIDHFFSKSTEEFIKKLMRGSAVYGDKIYKKKKRIKEYFKINEITLQKIEYIEEKTKINCSIYRNIIKKNI